MQGSLLFTSLQGMMVLSGLGRLVAPPLGNSLAAIAPGLPFAFWTALAALGCLGLLLVKGMVEDKALVTMRIGALSLTRLSVAIELAICQGFRPFGYFGF